MEKKIIMKKLFTVNENIQVLRERKDLVAYEAAVKEYNRILLIANSL